MIFYPELRIAIFSCFISALLWSCSSDDTAGTTPVEHEELVNLDNKTRYHLLLELQVAGNELDHAYASIQKQVTYQNSDDYLNSLQDDSCVLSIDDETTGFPQREYVWSTTKLLDVGPSLELSSATDVSTILHKSELGAIAYSTNYGDNSLYNFPYTMLLPDIDDIDFQGMITVSTVPESPVVALSPTSNEFWNSSEPVTWVASELPDTYIELQIFSEDIFMDCWLKDDGYFEGWQSLDNDFIAEANSLTLRRVVATRNDYGNSTVHTIVRRLN